MEGKTLFQVYFSELNELASNKHDWGKVRAKAKEIKPLWEALLKVNGAQGRTTTLNRWRTELGTNAPLYKEDVLLALMAAKPEDISFVSMTLYVQFTSGDHVESLKVLKPKPTPQKELAYSFYLQILRNKGATGLFGITTGISNNVADDFLNLIDNPQDGPLIQDNVDKYANWFQKRTDLRPWIQTCRDHNFTYLKKFKCGPAVGERFSLRKKQKTTEESESVNQTVEKEDAEQEVDDASETENAEVEARTVEKEIGPIKKGKPTIEQDLHQGAEEDIENEPLTTILPSPSMQVKDFLLKDKELEKPILISLRSTGNEIENFIKLVRYERFDEAGLEERMRKKWLALEGSHHRETLYYYTEILARDLETSSDPSDILARNRLMDILPENQKAHKRVFISLERHELENIARTTALELTEKRNNAINELRPKRPTRDDIKDLIRFAKGDMDVGFMFGHLKGWEKRNKTEQLRRLKGRLKVIVDNGQEKLLIEKQQSLGLKDKAHGYKTSTFVEIIPADEYVSFLTRERYNSQLGVVNYGQETIFLQRISGMVFTGKEINPLSGTNLGLPARLVKEFIKRDLGTTESEKAATLSTRISRVYHAPYKCLQIDLKEVVVRPGQEIEVFSVPLDESNTRRVESNVCKTAMESANVPVFAESSNGPVIRRVSATVRYFMVVVDCFSKHAWMFPMEKKPPTQIVANLHTLAGFCGWGYPHEIRMDNGSEFVAEIVKNELAKENVVITYGAVRTPEGQGVVERFNRTFKQYLNAVLRHKHFMSQVKGGVLPDVKFDLTFINNFLRQYNETVHSKIGASPNTIIHGRDPKLWARNHVDINERLVSSSLRSEADGHYAFDFVSAFTDFMRTKKLLGEHTVEAFKAKQQKHLKELADKNILSFFFPGDQCKFKIPTRFSENGVREWGWIIVIVSHVHLTQGMTFTNMYDVAPLVGGKIGEVYKGVRVEQLKRSGPVPKVVERMIDFAKRGMMVKYVKGMETWETEEELNRLSVVHNPVNTSFQIIRGSQFEQPRALPSHLLEKYNDMRKTLKEFMSYNKTNLSVLDVAKNYINTKGQNHDMRNFEKQLETLRKELMTRKELVINVNAIGHDLTALAHENQANTVEYQKLQEKFDDAQGEIYKSDKRVAELFDNESLLGALNVDVFFRNNLRMDSNVLISIQNALDSVYNTIARRNGQGQYAHPEDVKAFIVLLRMLGTAQRYIDFVDTYLGGADEVEIEKKESKKKRKRKDEESEYEEENITLYQKATLLKTNINSHIKSIMPSS